MKLIKFRSIAKETFRRISIAALIAALTAVPWLSHAANITNVSGADSPVQKLRTGKWGELTLIPIVISPPMELVSADWGKIRRPRWYFPGLDIEKAAQLLQSAGVSAKDAEWIRSAAKAEPKISGVVLNPDPDWVRALSPEIRAHIYSLLSKSDLNSDQVRAFRYPGINPESWLTTDLISPRTQQLVEPLIYHDGNFMLFSDIELVRPEINSEDELRRLSKTLFRQPTVIARLSLGPKANIDDLIEYWGRGGRQTKIRPLIESISASGDDRSIDIIHLLPPFAQERLYSYPTFSDADLGKPALVNCLSTALNFFLPDSDDSLLDPAAAIKTLKEDYFIVESDFKLGDVIAFVDKNGSMFHAAVYIADDLVFSKNGISSMSPWTLMSIDDVKAYYKSSSENPRLIFHRKRDI
jgi:hypothetical protein